MKKGEKIVGVVESVDFPNKGKVITEEGEQLSVKMCCRDRKCAALSKRHERGRRKAGFWK